MPPTDIATATLASALRTGAWALQIAEARGERARRLLNVAVASIGILLTAPLMLLIAAAIKLTSRGPIIYRQTRIGLDRRRHFGGNHRRRVDHGGKPFTIYKFRTMVQAPDGGQAQRWAERNDPRVTGLGRLLRTCRFDELPQLFNVLLGDMNIVGPRPEQPAIFAALREKIPTYGERQRVLPGITGWAQVNQHYDSCLDDVKRKVNYDLEYVERRSLSEDVRIMLKTFPTVAFGRGAW